MRTYLLTLALLPLAALAETKTACPASLPSEALTVRAPAGWTGYSPSTMHLSYAGIMAGPPESYSYLRPLTQKTVHGGSVNTWTFPDRMEKWLYCRYDNATSIQISKRLDDSATECTVRFSKSKFGGIESAVAVCNSGKP